MNPNSQKQPFFRSLLWSLAFLAAATFNSVWAQEKEDDSSEKKEEKQAEVVEEMVVTGTASGSQVRKLDASFAITTVSSDDMERESPNSTADLLKMVPGVWAESSGGVSGGNVFVRGFPGGGDAPFLTVQLNGSPIFPPPTLSFLENTTLFRVDETIQRMEALRGGPNPVFSNGQPGLTTNFILKEGSADTKGSVKYSTSDYDLRRLDAMISGEISDDFYYMVGGYLSSSDGVRPAGFNAEEGQQFTVNLTKYLDNGKINIFHRDTDDHGTWYLPAALNVPGVDSSYTQVGTLNRQMEITYDNNGGDPNFPNPQSKTLDLGEGRGWDGTVTGGSARFDFSNGWELVDRFNFTQGDADTVGLVPAGGAVNVGALLNDPSVDPNAEVIGALTGRVTGRSIGNSEYIQQFGAWEVRKNIDSFTNDLNLAKNLERGSATLGYYTANSSSDEFWSLGNSKYMVVENGGEIVDGIAVNDPSVDSSSFNYDIDARGDAITNALYAALTYRFTDALTFDVGVRYENHEVDYSVDEGLDGQVDLVIDTSESETSWTAALDYQLNDFSGVFGRINRGHKMPYFDDYRDNRNSYFNGNNLVQTVEQYEFGYKFAKPGYSLYATGFHTKVDPSFFVALSGQTPGIASINEATGVELDGSATFQNGFAISLNATIQESKIKGTADDGNEVQRQPPWQIHLAPRYSRTLGEALVSVFATLSAVDDRWSDNANTVVLDGYETVDLGVVVWFDKVSFQILGENITDSDGLTEGDPRNPAAPNGRFILPPSVKFTVGYTF
ncbi:MAG: TonB-dependent receptor [Acidobacteria bacterium]|nr:TonB-dependent receptor [Acidobacteriota bacterium]